MHLKIIANRKKDFYKYFKHNFTVNGTKFTIPMITELMRIHNH